MRAPTSRLGPRLIRRLDATQAQTSMPAPGREWSIKRHYGAPDSTDPRPSGEWSIERHYDIPASSRLPRSTTAPACTRRRSYSTASARMTRSITPAASRADPVLRWTPSGWRPRPESGNTRRRSTIRTVSGNDSAASR